MDKIKFYLEKYKIYILISFLILLILIILLFKSSNKKSNNIEVMSTLSSVPIEKLNKEKDNKDKEEKVIVDIKGYVNSPGVYELSSDKRIIDVINMAGGLLEEANTDYINLSKKVTDEMIIVIYSNNDVEKYKETDDKIIYIEYECVCPDNINDACITDKDIVNTIEKDGKEISSEKSSFIDEENDGKISINTATLDELMKLNGIGESKAKAIIKYREDNGLFKSIDEIKNVSGIGESAYEKIKDYIKI